MSEQQPTIFWYTGVFDNAGLDYFEPATPENQMFAIGRMKGLNEYDRNAKAFLVPLHLETEGTILELMNLGEIQYAKLVIESQEKIQYVKC